MFHPSDRQKPKLANLLCWGCGEIGNLTLLKGMLNGTTPMGRNSAILTNYISIHGPSNHISENLPWRYAVTNIKIYMPKFINPSLICNLKILETT